jgi:hypothetical protein
LLLGEPEGLAIGRIILADGTTLLGVLAEAILCDGQTEITSFEGWRAYQAAIAQTPEILAEPIDQS